MNSPATRSAILQYLCILVLVLASCDPASESESTGPTYEGQVKQILADRCLSCHQDGEIAPFALSTYDEARGTSSAIAHAIETGSMPPWPPDASCNSYRRDGTLSAEEKQTVLSWVDAGSPEGTADGTQAGDGDADEVGPYDLDLTMPEPYTPTLEPDDYRCFIMDWNVDTEQFVTGFRVLPGRRDVVHHVIAFVAGPSLLDEFVAMDEADPGPGYTCFGSPVAAGASQAASYGWRWLGSWAPGISHRNLPEGTGVRVEPGSAVVMQVHYNTLSSEPVEDLTTFQVRLADTIEKPAAVMPITNYQWISGSETMAIAADDPDAQAHHEIDLSDRVLDYLGFEAELANGDSFLLHSVGLHMHLLGTKATAWVEKADGSDQCLLDIPRWDFDWQGTYDLHEPIQINSGDTFHMQCHWDNSQDNQPIIDGERPAPQDVAWGEGTRDEMCLAILYVTSL